MKMRMLFCAFLILAMTASFAGGVGAPVRVTGVNTMKVFGQRLTAWYAKKNPALSFDVVAASPANSFAAMASGKTDVVQSSRHVLRQEAEALRARQGKSYVEIQVATEIAGIAVNSASPVRELSLFELRQILSSSARNWRQFGGPNAPIHIYGRDEASGVRSFIEDEFMGDQTIADSARTFRPMGRCSLL